MRPFRFGVTIRRAVVADDWIATARRAEALGYDIVLMPDHLGHQLSPIAGLASAAAATSRLRVGSYVLANDFRHPLILAREAATLDMLSGGRFELGLGAGWNAEDYRMLGATYDPPRRRIDRLAEAVPIVKRLLLGETIDHQGSHYRMSGAHTGIAPAQQPRLPLLIGGGGARMLRLAAQEADIVAIQQQFDPHGKPLTGEATEDALARKIAIVREAAGARIHELELNLIVFDAALLGTAGSIRRTPRNMVKSVVRAAKPHFLYGTLRQLRDRLLWRRDQLGISYYTLPGHTLEEMAPLVEDLSGR